MKASQWAVISADSNPSYLVYLPITKLFWDRLGFHTLVSLVGSEAQWHSQPLTSYVLEKLIEIKAGVQWVPHYEGHATHYIAQVSRIYAAAGNLSGADYLLTSDADMWPLSRGFFQKADASKDFHVWYANAYGDPARVEKFPICYLGGSVDVWREIMKIGQDTFYSSLQIELDAGLGRGANGMNAWCYDEVLFGRRLREWQNFRARTDFMLRDIHKIETRIDRARWHFDGTLTNEVDAHLPRVDIDNCGWEKMRFLVESILPLHLGWVDDFWEGFNRARSHEKQIVGTCPGDRGDALRKQ